MQEKEESEEILRQSQSMRVSMWKFPQVWNSTWIKEPPRRCGMVFRQYLKRQFLNACLSQPTDSQRQIPNTIFSKTKFSQHQTTNFLNGQILNQTRIIGSFRNLAWNYKTMDTNWRSQIFREKSCSAENQQTGQNTYFENISGRTIQILFFLVRKCAKQQYWTVEENRTHIPFQLTEIFELVGHPDRWHDLVSPGEKGFEIFFAKWFQMVQFA